MKAVKLKDRFEKAFEAFFEEKESNKQTELEIFNSNQMTAINQSELIFNKFTNILSKFLYGVSYFIGTSIAFDISIRLSWETAGLNNWVSVMWQPYDHLILVGVLFLGSFFSIIGLGKISKLNDFSIPFSIVGLGAIIGVLLSTFSKFFPEIGQWLFLNGYTVLFLPLGLMIGVLAKSIVDSLNQQQID